MLLLLAAPAQIWGEYDEHDHCTAIGLGRKATASGATMIAHTDDSGYATSDLRLVRIPAAKHKPGSQRTVHYFEGYFPRLIDASRATAYAPSSDSDRPSIPLGTIPQVTREEWEEVGGSGTREEGLRSRNLHDT